MEMRFSAILMRCRISDDSPMSDESFGRESPLAISESFHSGLPMGPKRYPSGTMSMSTQRGELIR